MTKHGDNPSNVYLLSNNHVFANLNQTVRATIPFNRVGSAAAPASTVSPTRFVPLHLGGVTPNCIDAAIGKLRPAIAHTAHVCATGAITGVASAADETLAESTGAPPASPEARTRTRPTYFTSSLPSTLL